MSYNVQLPNGTIIEIDDDVPPEEARKMIARKFPDLFDRKQGFMPAAKAGLSSGIGAIQTFGADVAEKAGMENIAKGLRTSSEKNREKAASQFDPTVQEDVDAAFENQGITAGIGALGRKYGSELAGSMAGSLVPSAAGAALGAVSPVPGGAAIGFSVPFFAQSAGENQLRQREVAPGQDADLMKSSAYALAQTALNFVGLGAVFKGGAAAALAVREAEKLVPQVAAGKLSQEAAVKMLGGRFRNMAADIAPAVGIGVGTNIADEALRRHQAGQELDSPDAMQDYRDIAIGSGIIAAPFGAATGARARGAGEQRIQAASDQRAAKIQQDQQRLDRARAYEAELAAAAQQAEEMNAPKPPTPPDPRMRQQEIRDSIKDGVSRAMEARQAAGVLNPQRPLEMIPGDPQARQNAQDTFGRAAIQQDMFGQDRAIDPAPAPRMDRTRATDQTPPLELDGTQQLPLPEPAPMRRAGDVRPEMRLGDMPPVDTAQPPLPLASRVDPRPPMELDAQSAQRDLLPEVRTERTRAGDEAPPPMLSNRESFKGVVYETSPTWKQGKLDGHDLNTGKGVTDLQKVLKSYLRHLEDNERNAQRRESLQGVIDNLEEKRLQLSAQPELDLKGGKSAPAVPAVLNRVDVAAKQESQNETGQQGGPDLGSGVKDMEVRGGPDAVPGRLPDAVGDADGIPDRVAGRRTGSEEPSNAALAAPPDEPQPRLFGAAAVPDTVQQMPEPPQPKMFGAAATPDPVQERANFGRNIGAVVDAGGHVLKGRQQAALGRAVEAGDFPGVLGALANSKNVMVKHLGEQAAKIGDVKIGAAKDNKGVYKPETAEIGVVGKHAKSEHVVAHEVAHAMTQHAIDNPTSRQKPIVAKLKKLFEFVKDKLKEEYGAKDIHEFVAEAYTNPDFQQKLSKIKYENTTAWGRFTQYVAQLLGLKPDNAFTEFLSLAETLEGTGLKATKNKASPKMLGSYEASTVPEIDRGVAGRMIDGAQGARNTGVKRTLSDWWDKVQMEVFDDKHGVTRHLERAWTRATGEGKQATARALLQASTYASQIARESLSVGKVVKNAEGFWKIERDPNNLKAFLDSVQALPTEDNKFRVANGILTNLSYAEREASLKNKQSAAQQMLAQGRQEMKAARQLKGTAGFRAMKAARAKIDAAKTVLDTEYQRPAAVTDETIAQAQRDAQDPAVKRMLDVVRGMNMNIIDTLEQGGVISKAAADLWRLNKHYVPLQRIMEDLDLDMPLQRGGSSTMDIRKFEGSGREVGDITENLIRQTMYATDAAMRNNANVKAMQELEAIPTNPAGVTRFDNHPGGRGVITLKEGGEKVFFRVEDPMAFKTFRGLVEDMPGLVNAMEHVTRFFREAIMLSPDAIFRNLVRDTAEVWAYDASNKSLAGVYGNISAQFLRSLPGVAREGFGTKLHQPHYEVQAYGITGAKEFTSLGAERNAIMREQLKRVGGSDWASNADQALDIVSRIFKPLQNTAIEGELAPRNHVFKEVLARTGSETEAAMAAINTLDFRRRGASSTITMAKKLVPFFNSALQGIYKLVRAVGHNDNLSGGKEAARRAFVIKGIQAAAAASVYQAIMSEDEEYMQVKKEIRDRNILVPLGEGMFLKIPLPFEFGSMFWTVPANVLDYYNGHQNGEEFKGALLSAGLHAVPGGGIPVPQASKPLLENLTNHSFFTGRPIESQSMQSLAPEQRAYSTTSELGKDIGGALGMSPIKVDNILKGYFGSLGQFFTDLYGQAFGDAGKPETPAHKLPLARSLITDPLQSSHRDRFYQLKETVDKVHATASSLAKQGKVEEAKAYLNGETEGIPNRTLYAMHRNMDALGRRMMKVNQMEKQIKAGDDSPEMKRARIEQLRRMTNNMIAQQMPALRQSAGQ